MSKIGVLQNDGQNPEDTAEDLKGKITTLKWGLDIRVLRQSNYVDHDRPSHKVYMRNSKHEFIDVGAGWSKKIRRGSNEGKQFISITIDDPSFEAPIYFQLFEDTPGTWEAVWTRPRSQNAKS